jgi:hypothetical protein
VLAIAIAPIATAIIMEPIATAIIMEPIATAIIIAPIATAIPAALISLSTSQCVRITRRMSIVVSAPFILSSIAAIDFGKSMIFPIGIRSASGPAACGTSPMTITNCPG